MAKVREGTIALDAIVIDQDYLSRVKPITRLINDYAEHMINGDQFPPIIVEEGTNKLFSGYHRTKAYNKYQEMVGAARTEDHTGQLDIWPDALIDIPCEWHTLPDGMSPKLYATSFNRKNSERQSGEDNKAACVDQYTLYPGCSFKLMMEHTGLSEPTIRKYLGELLQQFELTRNAAIINLNLLGWTQQEISDALQRRWAEGGLSRESISRLLVENEKVLVSTKNDFSKNITPATLSKRYDLPELVIWALALEEKTDQERLEVLDIPIQPYDVLHFQGCDDRFGTDAYPGRIPGQLIAHVLHWFTKPGDVVLDPMAGGGTVPDVCLAMGRHCYAYDINGSGRIDILPHNLATDGWPERLKKADLIFWDPPYFDKKDEGYPEDSISRLDREHYLKFFEQAFGEAKEKAKRGTLLAFLMSDWNDADGKKPGIFLWDYADLLRQAGWVLLEHIQVPLSTQQVHPDIVNKFREQGRRARLERYLLVART